MRRLVAFAACSIIAASAASAQTAPTQSGQHGLFDNGTFPPDASGLVTLGDLQSKLEDYVTSSALTATLDDYLTKTSAATTYALVTGTMTGTGNAYACVNATGQIYRSAATCQ